ncbi:MAG: rRNA adenine N-6-methyltransferase family protein [Thermodesulfovibrionia bacterium]
MATKWDEKRSDWYCRAIDNSDYPKKAVTALRPLLRTCDSVIDIGAGCGALSVPVAGLVKRVTAIEPSIWMYNLLLKRAKEAGVKNIRAYNTGWKGAGLEGNLHSRLKPHDMIICANLPHEVVCNVNFLRFITDKAKKFVVYMQSAGEWNRFYYKDLYPILFRRKYICEGDYVKTYTFLHQHGIFANIKISDYYLDQPFEDFNDALAFWRHRLKKKLSSGKERILADFLRKKLIRSRHRNTLIAPFGLRRVAFMWWKP